MYHEWSESTKETLLKALSRSPPTKCFLRQRLKLTRCEGREAALCFPVRACLRQLACSKEQAAAACLLAWPCLWQLAGRDGWVKAACFLAWPQLRQRHSWLAACRFTLYIGYLAWQWLRQLNRSECPAAAAGILDWLCIEKLTNCETWDNIFSSGHPVKRNSSLAGRPTQAQFSMQLYCPAYYTPV